MKMIQNKDDIISQADIVSIISSRIPLKKTGRSWKGSCPFHQERTPSFVVTPEKQIWHCYGCSKGGDIARFIMDFESVDFPDALEIIASESGLIVQYGQDNRAPQESGPRRQDLYAAIKTAADWYHQQIREPRNSAAIEYLYTRGFDDKLIDKYQLGYACGNSVTKCGASIEDLLDAKVLNTPKSTSKSQDPFDPLHGRVIIPLRDSLGRIVAFTGRAMEAKEGSPKYVNTAESKIFSKSACLFGYKAAQEMLRLRKKGELRQLLVLEGQLKAIAALENGYPAVAGGGTGFDQRQKALISRLDPERILMAMDRDQAGIDATLRVAPELRSLNIDVQIGELLVPEQYDGDSSKVDPDDLMAKGLPAEYTNHGIIEWLLTTFCSDLDKLKPADAITISKTILPLIQSHPNPGVREIEIRTLSRLTNISELNLRKMPVQQQPPPAIKQPDQQPRICTKMTPGRYLCAMLLQPSEYDIHYDDGKIWWQYYLNWLNFPTPLLDALQKVAHIRLKAAQLGIPVSTAIQQLYPNEAEQFLFWLSQDTVPANATSLEQINENIPNPRR